MAETVAGTSRAPGSSVISAVMLRLIIGSCATSVCRIDDETTACVDSTSGACPLTVMVSATAATPSFSSTAMLAPVRTSTRSRSCGAKPASSALTLYVPGFNAGTEYKPSSLVVVSRVAPVAVFVTVTVTPGRTAFAWSITRPLMLAVACANSELPVAKHNTIASPTFLNIDTNPPACKRTSTDCEANRRL